MSADATAWVIRHSPYKGVTFTIHFSIGDSVNDQNGNEFWMSMVNLAAKARTTRPTASETVAKLLDDGFLEILVDNRSPKSGKPSKYRFLFPDVPVVFDTRGVSAQGTPKPVGSGNRGVGSGNANLSAQGTGVSAQPTQTQRNPRENPTGTQEDDLDLVEDPLAKTPETRDQQARRVLNDWWEWKREGGEPPAVSYIGALKVIDKALANGVGEKDLVSAMRDALTISGNSIQVALEKRRQTGRGSQPANMKVSKFEGPSRRITQEELEAQGL